MLRKTSVGPLILSREVDRVSDWVDEVRKIGGDIIVGGKENFRDVLCSHYFAKSECGCNGVNR